MGEVPGTLGGVLHVGAGVKEKTVETGTVKLHYAETGPYGPPLVLLHGGSARWQGVESVMHQLRSLTKRKRFPCAW